MFIHNTPFSEEGVVRCAQEKKDMEEVDAGETLAQAIQAVEKPRGRPRKKKTASWKKRGRQSPEDDVEDGDDGAPYKKRKRRQAPRLASKLRARYRQRAQERGRVPSESALSSALGRLCDCVGAAAKPRAGGFRA